MPKGGEGGDAKDMHEHRFVPWLSANSVPRHDPHRGIHTHRSVLYRSVRAFPPLPCGRVSVVCGSAG